METRCFNSDGIIINYIIIRKKIKNMYMKFNDGGTLVISAPKQMPQKLIERFIKEKTKWIIVQKNIYDNSLKEKETGGFNNGDFKFFLGKKYYLQIVEWKQNQISIEEFKEKDLITIKVKSKYVDNYEYIRRLYEKWLKDECFRICSEYVDIFVQKMEKYKIPKPKIIIKKFKAKWGCCIPKKQIIEFSMNLVKTPTECIEYVVVHELAHFKYIHHNSEFYSFVSLFCHDWKNRRNLLNKKYGGIIN